MMSARTAYNRLRLLPFEVAFAGLAVFAGLVGLLDIGTSTDALTVLLPPALVSALNVTYTLAGLSLITGLAYARIDVEGFGLVQLAAAVLVRGAAIGIVAGFSAPVLAIYTLYGLTLWACASRLRSLFLARDAVRGSNGG